MTTLLTTLQAATLTISLNRPERANAFNFEMIAELRAALEQAATERTNPLRGADGRR